MRCMGIDYGLKKIGIAISESIIAEPLTVINVESDEDAVNKLAGFVALYKVDKIIIGISEGKMADKTRNFAKKLQGKVSCFITLHDETLSTKKAQMLSLEARKRHKKRKVMEDAYAAAVILQEYLDLNYEVVNG